MDERGESLLEVLVAVSIATTAIVAVLGLLAASIVVSDRHRKEADAHVVLTAALDEVKRQPYEACTATSAPSYSLAGVELPAGWSVPEHVTVTQVAAWDGDASVLSFASCPRADTGLQRVTVRTISPDGNASSTADVLKRAE